MKHLITIKRNSNYLAISDGKNPYILGFTNTRDARLVNNEIQLSHNDYQVYIRSDSQKNIAWNIKKIMLEVNLPIYNISEEVLIDNEATIVFPRSKTQIETQGSNATTLFNIKYDSFIQIPMRNNVGLLLPYKQIHMDNNMYIFNACLINSFIKEDVKDIWK